MFVAIDQAGRRIHAADADKETACFCPVCRQPVDLRAGQVNVKHFAHRKDIQCEDRWNYDMSPWHLWMQGFFPSENREVVVQHEGKTRRADILMGDVVVEIQHSPISAEEFQERNAFFDAAGYRLVWIFDVREQVDASRIQPLDADTDTKYRWDYPMRIFESMHEPLTDYDPSFAVYLYFSDDPEEYADCWRVVWTRGNSMGRVDMSRFATGAEPVSLKELKSPEDFLTPVREKRAAQLQSYTAQLDAELRAKGAAYQIKCIGERGRPRDAYVCPGVRPLA